MEYDIPVNNDLHLIKIRNGDVVSEECYMDDDFPIQRRPHISMRPMFVKKEIRRIDYENSGYHQGILEAFREGGRLAIISMTKKWWQFWK